MTDHYFAMICCDLRTFRTTALAGTAWGAKFLALAAFAAAMTNSAWGDLRVTVYEAKGNTVISWQGALDVSGMVPCGTSPAPEGAIFPKLGVLAGAGDRDLDVYLFRNLKTRPFGSGQGVVAKAQGDPILITNTLECNELCLCLPAGYRGETIKGEITFVGISLKDLHLDTTPFSYDLGGQFVHFFTNQDSNPSTKVAHSSGSRDRSGKKPEPISSHRRKFNMVLGSVFESGPGGGDVPSVAVRPVNPPTGN